MSQVFFQGITTALATPFKDGVVDYPSLKKLVSYQLDSGINGLVVAGSTGEAATLSLKERKDLLSFVLGEVSGAVPVIVGCGTNNTGETCCLAREFSELKPDGLLIVAPYYNKPPQRSMIRHFEMAAQNTSLPVIVYNVPARTGITMSEATIITLSQAASNIVGVKEAAGDVGVIERLVQRNIHNFGILSGDDGTSFDAMAKGAHGTVSVMSNVIPKWFVQAAQLIKQDPSVVPKLKNQAANIVKAMSIESNPIPVKWGLKSIGVFSTGEMRMPLESLETSLRSVVENAVKELR